MIYHGDDLSDAILSSKTTVAIMLSVLVLQMAILAENNDVTMVLVLQMANFSVKSFATIYKHYKTNLLNKNNGACTNKKYLVEYFKFRINISNFEIIFTGLVQNFRAWPTPWLHESEGIRQAGRQAGRQAVS